MIEVLVEPNLVVKRWEHYGYFYLRVYRNAATRRLVAIVTQRLDAHSHMWISTAAHVIWKEITAALGTDEFVFVEHTPTSSLDRETFEILTGAEGSDSDLSWRSVVRAEVELMIGGELSELDHVLDLGGDPAKIDQMFGFRDIVDRDRQHLQETRRRRPDEPQQ